MKTMTCKEMGGPCDLPCHGNTADDVIKAQDGHLREAVARGDATHQSALTSMNNRWKHPIAGMGWYRREKRDLATPPEDCGAMRHAPAAPPLSMSRSGAARG